MLQVSVLRVVDLEETDDTNSESEDDHPMPPPNPSACAKVGTFNFALTYRNLGLGVSRGPEYS